MAGSGVLNELRLSDLNIQFSVVVSKCLSLGYAHRPMLRIAPRLSEEAARMQYNLIWGALLPDVHVEYFVPVEIEPVAQRQSPHILPVGFCQIAVKFDPPFHIPADTVGVLSTLPAPVRRQKAAEYR